MLVDLLDGALWMGTATALAAEATKGTSLSVPFTLSTAGYGHDHPERWCVTNCVTITTYDHGLPWILGDA